MAVCSRSCAPAIAINTPLNNFDVFAQTFAEQYISFDLRHLDWVQAIAEQRGKVAAQTTPTELFDMLSGMIKPLADIHTGIEASKLKREFDAPLRPGSDRVVHGNIEQFAKNGRRALAEVTNRRYLRGPIVSLLQGRMAVRDGCPRVSVIFDSSNSATMHGADTMQMCEPLNTALDRILADPRLHGLIRAWLL